MNMNTFQELNSILVACRLCPRLVAWREQVAVEKRRAFRDWDYWGKPVPGFGDPAARVLVVGLAPGAHGSNRTGRMFTGDASGDFLYAALHRAGFANQPISRQREDGLALQDMYISAVCRCAPPDNRPTPVEIATCLPYLRQEIDLLTQVQVIVALGRIAFDAILRLYANHAQSLGFEMDQFHFYHGASYSLGLHSPHLIVSYHPSRQNTQTGRLTQAMFDSIWAATLALLH
jgi:uracil-DNA glycosylase family 4